MATNAPSSSNKSLSSRSASFAKTASLPSHSVRDDMFASMGVIAGPPAANVHTEITPEQTSSAVVETMHPPDAISVAGSSLTGKIITKLDPDVDKAKRHKVVVKEFVKEHIWKDCKFITDRDSQLAFTTNPNSLCQIIATGCKMTRAPSLEQWWATARKWVSFELTRLKSDKSNAIQGEYYRKSLLHGGA